VQAGNSRKNTRNIVRLPAARRGAPGLDAAPAGTDVMSDRGILAKGQACLTNEIDLALQFRHDAVGAALSALRAA